MREVRFHREVYAGKAVEDAVRIRTGEHGPDTVKHAARAMWGH